MPDFSFLPAFLEVSPRLLTSGQVAPADFARLSENGVEVVINLAAPGSGGYNPDEAWFCLGNGLQYVHLPVVFGDPQARDFETFAAIMSAQKGRTVLVHCAANMRVAAFIYAYRVKYEGEDEAIARARMEEIWSPHGVWGAFLSEVLQGEAP